DVAQFAVRGGIIDVYGFGMAAPARIEWSGDEIVSIRSFDLDTQRSEREVEEVTVLPVRPAGRGEQGAVPSTSELLPAPGSVPSGERRSLLDLLPPDALIAVSDGVELADVQRAWDEAVHHLDVARRRGEEVPGRDA